MIYQYDLTLPANTTKANELKVTCTLAHCKINRVEIVFPDGCCGLVYAALTRFNTQIIPINPTNYLRANNETVLVNTDILIADKPFEVVLHGYNLDDTFAHTIYCRLQVEFLSKYYFTPPPSNEWEE